METDQQSTVEKLHKVLSNPDVPMSKRMRVIFTLKNLGGTEAIDALKGSLTDQSVLLAHEVAYCMGQMQNPYAVESLSETLKNESLHPMVRHEAAEALGAIGGENAELVLNQYKDHPIREVKDTCQIALGLLNWKKNNVENRDANSSHPVFASVDPAPPSRESSLEELRVRLLNHDFSLFDRYQALFALRNLGTPDAIMILGEALNDVGSGAVFTHEVAYVLGQLQDKAAVKVLSKALKDESLNCMVRHEAAEALGNIAEEETVNLLKEFSSDKDEAVKSSCLVALDILDYLKSDQFQYADGLVDQ